MRVLQLVYCLDVGGLEQVVVDLCNNLPEEGVECALGCLSHAGDKARQTDVKDVWIGGLVIHRLLPDLRVLCSLHRYIRDQRIDLIHSHNPIAHMYGAVMSLITGLPHVQTVHGRGSTCEPFKRVMIRRMLTCFTNTVVAVSDDVRLKLLHADGLPERKLCTILNGVDTALYQPVISAEARKELRRQRHIPECAFVIGSVGRFAPEKNYPLMVEAFALFHNEYPDSCLVIVGDGSEMSTVRAAIDANGVQSCCVLPGMRSDIKDWMNCFDIFSLSSDTEGISVTLLEAMAAELPIVATDVGGNPEIVVDGTNGFLAPSGNAFELAKKFTVLANDQLMRQRFGINARERVVTKFSVKEMVLKYKKIYQDFS